MIKFFIKIIWIKTIMIVCILLLSSNYSYSQKKSPKYLLRPYVKSIGKNCFVSKIDYYRIYDHDDDWEDYWLEFRNTATAYPDWQEETTDVRYDKLKVDASGQFASQIHQFANEDIVYKNTSTGLRYPIVVNNRIKNILDSKTSMEYGYNKALRRRGTLTVERWLGFIFQVDEGRTFEEVDSTFNTTTDKFKEYFEHLVNDFHNDDTQILQVIGSASPDYEGDLGNAEAENIILAGLRAVEGVNFFISKYNDLTQGNLNGIASFDESTNTISLDGIGTERITAINKGITDIDDGLNDFITDRAVWFRLKAN